MIELKEYENYDPKKGVTKDSSEKKMKKAVKKAVSKKTGKNKKTKD